MNQLDEHLKGEHMIRNYKVALVPLLLVVVTAVSRADEPNRLTDDEQSNGWCLLFDGRTTAEWREYKSKAVPDSWKVENGSLLSRREKNKSSGDIISATQRRYRSSGC